MTGTIFDIQRFSVHDGPGIRTTVFMKGCPLRCQWCHNPEGLSKALQLQFWEETCVACGACGQRTQLSDAEKCPANALRVCGRVANEDEILQTVLRDQVFYADQGGVTFSGGECLLQADFVASVIRLAKAQNIHTAIDTCGYVPWSEIEKTLECCDLYLYDVKCFTPSLHKKFTGVDNAVILENLQRLAGCGKDIWIRIPVIPTFNDDPAEMEAIAGILAPLSCVNRVTLMPYHVLGASKYKTLGLTYPFPTGLRISPEQLAAYRRIFEAKNIPVL